MKLPFRPRRPPSDSIVPLINIVFLLLIFYMLTGSLARPELFRIDPPTSKSKTQGAPEPSTILLAADGRLAFGNKAMSLENVRKAVAARFKANPKIKVEIKADAKVPARHLLLLLDELRNTGVQAVGLTTSYHAK